MNIMIDEGCFMPVRGHANDAGLDLLTPVDIFVPAGGSAVINTGIHVEIAPGFVGMLKSKSGLNVKDDITTEGVIDAGYTGSIVCKLYNHGKKDKHFKRGEKVTQLVILPVNIPDKLNVVSELAETERGSNGFGSTGA